MRNRYLEHSKTIGNLLLEDFDEKGRNHPLLKSVSIYDGMAGVFYFLYQLYEETKDVKYLNFIKSQLDNFNDELINQKYGIGLFNGILGFAVVLTQMEKLTNREKILNNFLVHITSKNVKKLKNYDLLSGISGILLGAIQLHSFTNKDEYMIVIESCLEQLINNSRFGKKGVYWIGNRFQSKGLTGLSHGVSGISYALYCAGKYLKNNTLISISKLAINYEDQFFDSKKCNWGDFRHGYADKNGFTEHKNAYIRKDLDFFKKVNYTNAWCNGATGIGLMRLSIPDVTLSFESESNLKKSVKSVVDLLSSSIEQYDTFTLCHGRGGNALFLLEYYKRNRKKEYLELVYKTADDAIKYKEEFGKYLSGYPIYNSSDAREDQSLFMGNAGIGYFFLKCFKQNSFPKILLPNIETEINFKPTTSYNFINISPQKYNKIMCLKYYPKTMFLLKSIDQKRLNNFLVFTRENFADSFHKFVKSLNVKISNDLLIENHDTERKKLKLEQEINPCYQYIKSKINRSDPDSILTMSSGLDKIFLKTDNESIFYLSSNVKSEYRILFTSVYEIEEIVISPLVKKILEELTLQKSIEEVLCSITSSVSGSNKEPYHELRKKILLQIIQCLKKNLIQ
jgi:hypothetical protein